MTKEAKTQIVIDNYFKSECDVNTSIRKAFEKGFRIGVQKGSVAAEPVRHGHWIMKPNGYGTCSNCKMCSLDIGGGMDSNFCPNCGAKMDECYMCWQAQALVNLAFILVDWEYAESVARRIGMITENTVRCGK